MPSEDTICYPGLERIIPQGQQFDSAKGIGANGTGANGETVWLPPDVSLNDASPANADRLLDFYFQLNPESGRKLFVSLAQMAPDVMDAVQAAIQRRRTATLSEQLIRLTEHLQPTEPIILEEWDEKTMGNEIVFTDFNGNVTGRIDLAESSSKRDSRSEAEELDFIAHYFSGSLSVAEADEEAGGFYGHNYVDAAEREAENEQVQRELDAAKIERARRSEELRAEDVRRSRRGLPAVGTEPERVVETDYGSAQTDFDTMAAYWSRKL